MPKSSGPKWRAAIRGCRLCHDKTPPLIFSENERIAKPLFHEDGNLKSPVLFVVEAPNWTDTFDPDKGRMTIGEYTDPSGQFFDDRLEENLKLSPCEILCTNSVLCLPARVKGKYPVMALQKRLCSPHLRSLIENVNPKVVVPQGGVALEALKLIEQHSLVLKDAVAKRHDWFGRILFPLYHPGALSSVARSRDKQVEDFQKLKTLLDSLLPCEDNA